MTVEIFEAGDYRARLVREDYRIEWPDWDGLGFVAQIETGYRGNPRIDWVVSGDYVPWFGDEVRKEIPPYFDDALYRFGHNGSDLDKTIRYLKIFHDVAAADYVTDYQSSATYLILITHAQLERWGERWGTPADLVEECLKGTVEIVRQTLDGDVYGYVIEQRVTWQPTDRDRYLELPTMTTWEEVDSLWGLYGREYAEREAWAALEAEVAAQ